MIALLAALAANAAEPDVVSMSLPEFLRLYESTKTRPKDPEPAPAEWVAGSAKYTGEVLLDDGQPVSAQFSARIHLEVLKDKGWAQIWLLPATVALQSAKIGNTEVGISLKDGWYYLVTDRKGAFDLDLKFAASVQDYNGSAGIAFELPPVGASEFEIAVPSSDALDFTVANAKIKSDRTEGGRRVVNATLVGGNALSVQWQREARSSDQGQQVARVYAQVYTLVGVGDGVLHATSTIDHTILFAGVNQLKAAIPEGMTVLDVRGAGLGDWRVGGDRVLTADLNYAAEGSYSLTVELERVVGEGSLSLDAPLIVPIGVERSKGWVGVESRGTLEITGGDPKNATPVDVRTLPASILGVTAQPVLLGYKYLGTDVKIPLTVAQHEDIDVLVTLIDQARATTMFTADGRRLTSVQYQMRNNRRQFLRLALPEGAELWSAAVAGRAVQPAKAGDGKVMIPLVRSSTSGGALAGFNVEVVYVESGTPPSPAGRGTFRAALPGADVPSTWVGWTVYAPADAKVKKGSLDGSLRDVDYLHVPANAGEIMTIDTYTPQMQQSAGEQLANGGLGQGAAPVPVSLPLEGTPWSFEKLLALDEELWVEFDYKGLK